jgi:hypothetical protein
MRPGASEGEIEGGAKLYRRELGVGEERRTRERRMKKGPAEGVYQEGHHRG